MMLDKLTAKVLPYLKPAGNLMALLVTVALLLLMFPRQGGGTHYDYGVGSFWNNGDLYAPFDFNVPLTPEENEKAVAEAKSKSLLYFEVDSTAHYRALQRLETLSARHNIPFNTRRQLRRSMDSIYRSGYVVPPEGVLGVGAHTLVLLQGNIGSEHRIDEYVTPDDVANELLRDSILVPSIAFDEVRTRLELDARLSQTSYHARMVQEGALVIAKGEYVTQEKAQTLRALEAENDLRFAAHYSMPGHLCGQAMLILIAFAALYLFLLMNKYDILTDSRKLTMVLSNILLISAAIALAVRVAPDYVLVVPLCVVPIMMRIFFDMRVALYIHLTTVIILANMVPNSYEFIFYQLVTGMMSIISVKNFESRSKFFIVGCVIFFTYSLIYTSGVLSQDTHFGNIRLERYGIFFANALLTLLVYPLIYLAEKLFGQTSMLTLLEISNTNTPALRELSRKAPGTFQHSMQVANISEDLINEIGGNSLLAKVGALYHDIGKTVAPLNFTENQTSDFNPHVELDYEESAQLITRHVTDGIDLARKYRLPASVIDFIRTHHGTTYTGYFYAKMQELHPDGGFDKTVFRYPGPMPFTRETAVVMIVDSVEAACKSMKSHTQEEIDRLVDKIIFGKIEAGQLSNCDLTFGDISRIRKILKSRMLSIYHARIAYPVTRAPKP
ncbi:MAG: hypothetical protein AUK63_476 [bacterium P3]|nr:MAG: hypothetical protein AUK63_476 [bacterium P3]KWW41932.1 MAG: hypothetical protein F083_583 [bacterium F083]